MRFFKRFFCLFLIFPMILLVSCDDSNKNNDNSNNSDQGDGEIVEETITTSEILEFAFESFDNDSKKQVETKNCLSAKNGNDYVYSQYDEFVYISMKMLDEISKLQNLQEDVWCYDDSIEIIGNNLSNKVSKFYVSTSELSEIVKVNLYLQTEIVGMNFSEYSKSYDLYCYEINYYPKVDKVSVEIQVDKSRNYITAIEEKGSYATYYLISYSNGVLVANTFKRLIDIELSSTAVIVPSVIIDYASLRFNFSDNTALQTEGFTAGTNYANLQEYLFDELVKFKNNYDYVNGLQSAQTKIDGLTSSVLKYVNAYAIADIVD